MKPSSPRLLPVLRSRLIGDLLALLLIHPDRTWRLDELAERTGAAYPTVTREIRLLEEADLIRSTMVGRTKLVEPNRHNPDLRPLTDLMVRSFGPPVIVAEEFADMPGVERLYLYGSWAARHADVPGPDPRDIDVLVLGHPDRDAVYDAARRAERRLGREVNTTIRSLDAWERADDAFTRTVKAGPLLELTEHQDTPI